MGAHRAARAQPGSGRGDAGARALRADVAPRARQPRAVGHPQASSSTWAVHARAIETTRGVALELAGLWADSLAARRGFSYTLYDVDQFSPTPDILINTGGPQGGVVSHTGTGTAPRVRESMSLKGV